MTVQSLKKEKKLFVDIFLGNNICVRLLLVTQLFLVSTASVDIYGCGIGLSGNLCAFVVATRMLLRRYPPFPLMFKLNPVWDLMWEIVGGGQ